MHSLVESSFVHLRHLHADIKNGNYDIVKSNGDILLPQVWETVVKPGTVLEIRIRSLEGMKEGLIRGSARNSEISTPQGATPDQQAQKGCDDRSSRESYRPSSIKSWLKRQRNSRKSDRGDEQ